MMKRHAWLFIAALLLGCFNPIQAAFAQTPPGTVLLNRSRAATVVTNGTMTINQQLGPYQVPVQVFLTALGSATGKGARSSLRTQISFGQVVHASNSDEYELPDSVILQATANFDFILSKGQTTNAVITVTGKPVDMSGLKLRLFYKAIAVACQSPTIC